MCDVSCRSKSRKRSKPIAEVAVSIWITAATCATAQWGQVVGQVTDAEGLPLAGVTVQGGSAAAVTDPGGRYRLEGVAQEERVVVAFAREGYATTYGIVNLAPPDGGPEDADGDGVPDGEDECPSSDLRPTVVVAGCDSGVDNVLLPNGCTVADLVSACAGDARNHGEFVRCVQRTLRALVAGHVMAAREASGISRCAARAPVPPRDGDRVPGDTAAAAGEAPPPTFATLNKVMVPCGEAQVVSAEAGGVVEQDGFRVTFLPGSIDTVGDVEVVLCPIDVASRELGAFPGDFLAVAMGSGELVLLETFSLMDVSLTQGGAPVDLVDGAEASLEFLLPDGVALSPGETVGLWSFDRETGLWVEEAEGLVTESSFDRTRLSVVGMVSHFSWWNCDRPIETFSCVQGVVRDEGGSPVANAQVVARGVDYSGASFGSTDANGFYCVNVRIDSIVEVTASLFSETLLSASATVATGAANVTCAVGGCVQQDFTLPASACIQGVALDTTGAPVAGLLVSSTAGTFATTDADGAFCLAAPAESQVSVLALGFSVESVLTPGGGASCATSDCVAMVLEELPPVGDAACIRGALVPDDFNPLAETVVAVDAFTLSPVGTVVALDADYAYCIDGVPPGLAVYVESLGPACTGAKTGVFTTAPTAGNCGAPDDCVVAPDLDNCFGGAPF